MEENTQNSSESSAPNNPPTENINPNEEITQQFSSRIDLTELQEVLLSVKNEIRNTIVGQETMLDLLLVALLSDGHVLIEGVPGVAKTLTAKLLAHTISVDFSRIQFTPDLMPSDIIGTSIFNQKIADFEFKKGPLFSNIILIDEINRSPAKTQAALFEVMEEHQITSDGDTYKMKEPFLVLATQNPLEQEGTYRLPEAQLDRFLFKIEVGYPTEEQETKLLMNFHLKKDKVDVLSTKKILTAEQLIAFRKKVAEVYANENIIAYITKIVTSTRNNNALYIGASPRASLAILKSAKAYSAMQGRDFITPDDVKFVTPHVLKHRIILTPEKEMEGILPHQIVTKLIESIEIPR